jgi:hypothetical protein
MPGFCHILCVLELRGPLPAAPAYFSLPGWPETLFRVTHGQVWNVPDWG